MRERAMSGEPKPCPFCGGEARLAQRVLSEATGQAGGERNTIGMRGYVFRKGKRWLWAYPNCAPQPVGEAVNVIIGALDDWRGVPQGAEVLITVEIIKESEVPGDDQHSC